MTAVASVPPDPTDDTPNRTGRTSCGCKSQEPSGRLVELRGRNKISDEVLRRIEHELDIEELRWNAGSRRQRG